MTDNNSLYSSPKAPDEFRTESPLRGFSEYTEFGGWLVAKGFKPSLQHLTRYLAGMESREGYRLVQILEAATGVPTMIFRTTARAPLDQVADAFKPAELRRDWEKNRDLDFEEDKPFVNTWSFTGDDLDRIMVQWRGQTIVMEPYKEEEAEVLGTITDWTPPGGCVHGFWEDGRFFIDFPAAVSQGHAIAVGPPGYVFYGFKQDNPAVAFYVKIDEEVTSESILPAIVQNPVDVLESMCEDIAEDLGLEVDRESFEVAREHLAEMVPAESVPDDVYFNLESGNFYQMTTNRGMGMTFHNKWWGRRAEFITKKLDGLFHLPEMVPLDLKVPGECKAEIVYDAGKFDDANPEHYNGWECGDIGERLTANGYQILKYCWRLGKKDDPCKELGKALRYLDREMDYLKVAFPYNTITPIVVDIEPKERLNYLLNRTANQSQFTADVARFLWDGYTVKDLPKLKAIIADHKAQLDCGHGLAI